jgi:hypothetical protein
MPLVNGMVQQPSVTSTAPSITPPLPPGSFTTQKGGVGGAAESLQPLLQALMKAKMQQKLAGQLPGTPPPQPNQPPAGGQGGTAADSYMPLSLGGNPIGPR